MLSDQKMITGIALLVSGYSQLGCSISEFHWQIMVYLVWYSFVTHLATLTVLKRYLWDNMPMRWWRLLLIFLVLAGLCIALIPTGCADWLLDLCRGVEEYGKYTYLGTPAVCLFSTPVKNYTQLYSVIVSISVLGISYTTRTIKLFQWSSKKTRQWFRAIPGETLSSVLDELHEGIEIKCRHRRIISIPYWLILYFYVTAKAYFDLAEPMLSEVTVDTSSLYRCQ
jgi:hypothetical protein